MDPSLQFISPTLFRYQAEEKSRDAFCILKHRQVECRITHFLALLNWQESWPKFGWAEKDAINGDDRTALLGGLKPAAPNVHNSFVSSQLSRFLD